MSREIIEALRQIEKEKGIAFEALVEALEEALLSAYRKTTNAVPHAKVEVDTETGDMRVYELIFPDHIDIDALKVHDEEGEEIGLDLSGVDMSEVERVEVTPENFGRIAAQTAKQVILQRIREAERDLMYEEYVGRVGELVTGIVQQSDPRHNLLVELGRVEADCRARSRSRPSTTIMARASRRSSCASRSRPRGRRSSSRGAARSSARAVRA